MGHMTEPSASWLYTTGR
eukprot:jgi/Mesen1/6846/ME000351S05953